MIIKKYIILSEWREENIKQIQIRIKSKTSFQFLLSACMYMYMRFLSYAFVDYNALSDADSRRSLSYVLGHSISTDFPVIKTGKKYEKLFFFWRKNTLFGILEIQFLKISHCSRF